MKRYSILLLAALVACQTEPVSFSETPAETSLPGAPIETSSQILDPTRTSKPIPGSYLVSGPNYDWSGLIETRVYSEEFDYPANRPYGYVTVPWDYVLVGGGAETFDTDNSKGAFLTESRPHLATNSWHAASKDHVHVDPHRIRIFAIGMKITGVSASTLRAAMVEASSSSSLAYHPSKSVLVPNGYTITGGGARVNYGLDDGNLLVYSYPSYPLNVAWNAKAKDHVHSSLATIDVWVIGIADSIPGLGNIDVSYADNSAYINTGKLTVNSNGLSGYAPTCAAAVSTYDVNEGRMICGMRPAYDAGSGSAISKDINIASNGWLTTMTLGIRKRP